ncbi:hypothetical protein BO94DRAFT_212670 [Aspergillus sclerotioniger CBS 115572]|uniref:Uncharacterized protein n=1 Tax=Aspergillus sclerotioniger CBS 115572 TaxID=1450535 RepID=A0A317VLU0_9EURO|nr:hypothetical protein BO94DRAFT_212670 [Aspergillus sclerotioniger CBS 115572]PWY75334.1 hypothetical protein BO94DRAFT_212670 [Aspergillus sclerotioniger CBS 115572]
MTKVFACQVISPGRLSPLFRFLHPHLCLPLPSIFIQLHQSFNSSSIPKIIVQPISKRSESLILQEYTSIFISDMNPSEQPQPPQAQKASVTRQRILLPHEPN